MGNDFLNLLNQGVSIWNNWRNTNPNIIPYFESLNMENRELSGINFQDMDLRNANFIGANLSHANFKRANLYSTDLRNSVLGNSNFIGAVLENSLLCNADFRNANFKSAFFKRADASYSDFTNADLIGCDLRLARFKKANLLGADISYSRLIDTDFSGAELTNVRVHGTSVWDVIIDEETIQNNLIITKSNESDITIDSLELSQFVYLILNNKKIRDVIDTLATKIVLILGRFSLDRKPTLDALKLELRKYNLTPVLFDFEKPTERNFIESVSILAHLSRFVIADFTDAKVILQEAEHIVRNVAIPFAPIMRTQSGFEPITLYDLRKGRTTVLNTYYYKDVRDLAENLEEKIVIPAENLAKSLNQNSPI